MSRRKIKQPGGYKPRPRGRLAEHMNNWSKNSYLLELQAARKRRAILQRHKGTDAEGRECYYCKLRLEGGKRDLDRYKKAMAVALFKWAKRPDLSKEEEYERDTDVMNFIQGQVNTGMLIPAPCVAGDIPIARVYFDKAGKLEKVIAMRKDDPGVQPLKV